MSEQFLYRSQFRSIFQQTAREGVAQLVRVSVNASQLAYGCDDIPDTTLQRSPLRSAVPEIIIQMFRLNGGEGTQGIGMNLQPDLFIGFFSSDHYVSAFGNLRRPEVCHVTGTEPSREHGENECPCSFFRSDLFLWIVDILPPSIASLNQCILLLNRQWSFNFTLSTPVLYFCHGIEGKVVMPLAIVKKGAHAIYLQALCGLGIVLSTCNEIFNGGSVDGGQKAGLPQVRCEGIHRSTIRANAPRRDIGPRQKLIDGPSQDILPLFVFQVGSDDSWIAKDRDYAAFCITAVVDAKRSSHPALVDHDIAPPRAGAFLACLLTRDRMALVEGWRLGLVHGQSISPRTVCSGTVPIFNCQCVCFQSLGSPAEIRTPNRTHYPFSVTSIFSILTKFKNFTVFVFSAHERYTYQARVPRFMVPVR